ncbi:MAG: hypothetical protein ACFFD4_08215 [Candidatus Odinarchaeota archaeon]
MEQTENWYDNIPEDSTLRDIIEEASAFGRLSSARRKIGAYWQHFIIPIMLLLTLTYLLSVQTINDRNAYGFLTLFFGAIGGFFLILFTFSFAILKYRAGGSKGVLKIDFLSPDDSGRTNLMQIDVFLKRHVVLFKDSEWYSKLFEILDEKGQLSPDFGSTTEPMTVPVREPAKDKGIKELIKKFKAEKKDMASSDKPRFTAKSDKHDDKIVVDEISPLIAAINGLADINVHVLDFENVFEFNGKKLRGTIIIAEGKTLEEILPAKTPVFCQIGFMFGTVPAHNFRLIPVAKIGDVPLFILESTRERNVALAHEGRYSSELPSSSKITAAKNLIELHIARILHLTNQNLVEEIKTYRKHTDLKRHAGIEWAEDHLDTFRLLRLTSKGSHWLLYIGIFVFGAIMWELTRNWWMVNFGGG